MIETTRKFRSGNAVVIVTLVENEEGEERPFYACTVVGHSTGNTSWSFPVSIEPLAGNVEPGRLESFESAARAALSHLGVRGREHTLGGLGGAENIPETGLWRLDLIPLVRLELPLDLPEAAVDLIEERLKHHWPTIELEVDLSDTCTEPELDVQPPGSPEEYRMLRVIQGTLERSKP